MRVRIQYRTICVTLLWLAVGALAATLWAVRGEMREMEERLETIEERPATVLDLWNKEIRINDVHRGK